jgi:hypothetical protein
MHVQQRFNLHTEALFDPQRHLGRQRRIAVDESEKVARRTLSAFGASVTDKPSSSSLGQARRVTASPRALADLDAED